MKDPYNGEVQCSNHNEQTSAKCRSAWVLEDRFLIEERCSCQKNLVKIARETPKVIVAKGVSFFFKLTGSFVQICCLRS